MPSSLGIGGEFRITTMCRVLRVHRSGFYAWMKAPLSARQKEDDRLFALIKHFWNESDQTYGSPRIHRELVEAGERVGENRVAKIMRQNRLMALQGYKKRRFTYGRPSKGADNLLNQDFSTTGIDQAWVTDITHVATGEGWLYLCVVMDLCSRRIIGWSMQATLHRDLVIKALLMAVWNRNPEEVVVIHSDQGSQFGSDDWVRFCRDHGLERNMSRRGNCYDNAAMESFFSSLKKERVRPRPYRTRAEAQPDIFDYIEAFYNRKRRHKYLNHVSPVEFERQLMSG
jgi:putative transposase